MDFSPSIQWESANEDIVKVEKGKLVAVKPGQTELKATFGSFSDTVRVTVREKVVTVENGTVKAVKKGIASVRATYGGKSLSFRITVK